MKMAEFNFFVMDDKKARLQSRGWGKWIQSNTHTRTPVTTEAMNVPRIANVTMAPKFEKKGFYTEVDHNTEIKMHSSLYAWTVSISFFIRIHQMGISKKENHENLRGLNWILTE